MSHTGNTYTFSTFQELVDRVPADRIPLCPEELGKILGTAKEYQEAIYETAKHLASKKGTELPPCTMVVPPEFEWIDDGKGDLGFTMQGPDDSKTKVIISKTTP